MTESATITCSACLKDGIQTVDVVRYCVDCNENLCKPCLRRHIKTHATSPHRMIGRDELSPWMKMSAGGRVGGEETCTRHPDNMLIRFCEDHDMLCCGECEELEHSSCNSVVSVKEAVQKNEANGRQPALVRDLKRLAGELSYELGKRKELQVGVRKSTVKSLAAVRELRERANILFEELERKALDEINSECIDTDNEIESDISQIGAMTHLLDDGVKQMDSTSDSSLQFLLRVQKGKQIQTNASKLLSEIKTSKINSPKEFILNQVVSNFLDKLQSLGGYSSKTNKFIKLSIDRDVNIRSSSDSSTSDIHGIAFMKDGTIVLTDYENGKLKCLKSSFQVNEDMSIQLIGEPFAVCATGDNEICVSIPGMKMVQFMSMTPGFVLKGCIQVGECCRGLAYSYLYDELYVACGGGSLPGEGLGQVRVYNRSGTLLRTFKVDGSGKPITSQPMSLAISNDGSKLHVADSIKGVITLDRHGTVLSIFTALELDGPHGVCVDVSDNVIVCGNKSSTVIHMQKDGKDTIVLVGEGDGIKHPVSVCYDVRASRLVISNGFCDSMKVFTVTHV